MGEFGSESWKMYNTVLVQMLDTAQKQLADLRYLYCIDCIVQPSQIKDQSNDRLYCATDVLQVVG